MADGDSVLGLSEAGFDNHLTKPFEPAALEKLLADYKKTKGL